MKSIRVKSFIELPNLYKSASCFTSESVEDLYFDDTSMHSSSDSIRHQARNCDSTHNFDSSSESNSDSEVENNNFSHNSDEVKKLQTQVSEDLIELKKEKEKNKDNINEMDTNQRCRYKSLLSLIKALKKFSVSLKSKSDNETRKNTNNCNIYRQLKRPTEYVYVRGMSGLSNRIEKAPMSSNCNRCTMRNG